MNAEWISCSWQTVILHLSLLTSCLCVGQSETHCTTHTFLIISSCLVSVCAAWHCSCPSVFVFPCVTLWITLTSCWHQESNSKRLSMSQKTQISPNNSCSDWLLVSAWLFGAVWLLSTWQIGFLSAALMHSVYVNGPTWSTLSIFTSVPYNLSVFPKSLVTFGLVGFSAWVVVAVGSIDSY